jgi:hypothetical protein
LCFSVL